MSDMFSNYELVYNAPNNLTKVHNYVHCRMPNTEYNDQGKLIAYTWKYGETVNLKFQLTGTIKVNNDAIVYVTAGEYPTESTIGYLDQKAYNVVDIKSWTCTAIMDDSAELKYIWSLDSEFTYPFNGGRSIYVSLQEYIKDKKVLFTFMNNRYEVLFEQTIEPEDTFFVVPINEELSQTLKKGVYYFQIAIISDNNVIEKIIADVDSNTINIR